MAKTPTVKHSEPARLPDLSLCYRDIEDWPRSWMGFDKDIAPGEKIVACFRPFLEHLIALRLSRKTIRKHVDNLWVLGGEIIRELHEHPSLRKKQVERVLLDLIHDGGPLIYHCASEEQQSSFDSTCRKLRRFIASSPS